MTWTPLYSFVTVEKLFGSVQSFAKRQKKRRYQENNKNICFRVYKKIYIFFKFKYFIVTIN